jgi:hypothetical protein
MTEGAAQMKVLRTETDPFTYDAADLEAMGIDRLAGILAETIVWTNLWTRVYVQQLDAIAYLQPVLNELQRRRGPDWAADETLRDLYDEKVAALLKEHDG